MGVYTGIFETYTKYSEVADEKKKILGAIAFLNSLFEKRVWETLF